MTPSLPDRLQTHRAMREARGASPAELALLDEMAKVLEERERFLEKYLTLRNLFDLPRLQGGVLSIAHDIDPRRRTGTPSTTVMRHEFRGRMREVELGWRDDLFEGLNSAPWRDRVIPAGDLLEALKVPMLSAAAQGGEGEGE